MRLRILLLCLFWSCSLFGQEIVINSPTEPLEAGSYVILQVKGLAEEDLPKSLVEVEPADGVNLFPAKTWGGEPIIIFSAKNPGKYQMTIFVNRWRLELDSGASAAEQAKINPSLLNELKIVVKRIGDEYPAKSGACTIQVGEPVPPTPTPTPPPPPTPTPTPTGKRQVVILYETDSSDLSAINFDRRVLNPLRSQSQYTDYWKSKEHTLFVLDPNSPDAQPFIPNLEPGNKPTIVISDRGTAKLLYHGPCPSTAAEVLDLLKKNGG